MAHLPSCNYKEVKVDKKNLPPATTTAGDNKEIN